MPNLANMIAKIISTEFGGHYIKDLDIRNIRPDSLFLEAKYRGQNVLILVPNDAVAKSLISLFICYEEGVVLKIHENVLLKNLPSFNRIFDLTYLEKIFKSSPDIISKISKKIFLKSIENFHSEDLSSFLNYNIGNLSFNIVDLDYFKSNQIYTLSIFDDKNVAIWYHFLSFEACSHVANLLNQYCLSNDIHIEFNITNSFDHKYDEGGMIISL